MVINVKRQWRCERCGAQQKEAILTRSHSPQQWLAQVAGVKGIPDSLHVYCLCVHCHTIWSKMERQVLWDTMDVMIKKHEEFLNR
jgi:hypothetical protein